MGKDVFFEYGNLNNWAWQKMKLRKSEIFLISFSLHSQIKII